MLKLAYDFSRRAITTLRGRPIADSHQSKWCDWRPEDLAPELSAVVRTNELDRLSDDVLALADNYKHSRGRGFQEHLQGVAGLLMRWNQDPLTIQTGLFHSAYSTQQYPYGLYSYGEREQLQSLIGKDGERLVFLFCSHDRVDLYAQAIELMRTGDVLTAEGLCLRNALTGDSAQVPGVLVAHLMVVHAADLAEQMDGFDFEMIAALLSAAEPWTEAPACLQAMRDAGLGSTDLSIVIKPERGTFGLAPVLGLSRKLLTDRIALARLLRGKGALSGAEEATLAGIEQRLPGLVEVPWIRLIRSGTSVEPGSDLGDIAQDWLAEVRARYQRWGVTWLKRPFDRNSRWERLVEQGEAWSSTGNLQG